jgi:predicted RNA-binding Zn-ribbon protein involved in translation (DUF1610 family)
MSEAKKCPECGGEMEEGDYLRGHHIAVRLMKYDDFYGDKVIPFYCKNCGFIKLYREMKKKKD